MSNYLLSICVPTVIGRELKCEKLIRNLDKQIADGGFENFVEIIIDRDNKEVSIGAKRDRMYKHCNGLFSVQLDDDDNVPVDYLKTFFDNFDADVDCYGYQELCTFDSRTTKKSDFSIKHKKWFESKYALDGFNYFRTPFCKTPIKTSICKFVGVKDLRFGEDHEFAIRVFKYLRTEKYINKIMYHYIYTSENHASKYGIK